MKAWEEELEKYSDYELEEIIDFATTELKERKNAIKQKLITNFEKAFAELQKADIEVRYMLKHDEGYYVIKLDDIVYKD